MAAPVVIVRSVGVAVSVFITGVSTLVEAETEPVTHSTVPLNVILAESVKSHQVVKYATRVAVRDERVTAPLVVIGYAVPAARSHRLERATHRSIVAPTCTIGVALKKPSFWLVAVPIFVPVVVPSTIFLASVW